MSCIREVAMMEPLVDTVQGDQVVSPAVELKVRCARSTVF